MSFVFLSFLLLSSAAAFQVSLKTPLPILSELRSTADGVDSEPRRNPDRPELPELKNDFDWDAKFGRDDDWITENVPGKMVVENLAEQSAALDSLEEKWRRSSMEEEYESSRKTGWVPEAELANGRVAMFFLATGLLTELWTGVSMPGQVEELLRIGGVIGFDG